MRTHLATMVTTTTYGTWLPGDVRGYVEDGRMLPGNAELHKQARSQMRSKPVSLTQHEQDTAFDALLLAAQEYQYSLLEVSIEAWHLHWLIRHGHDQVSVMVGRLKNRMRQAVNRGRIWTQGYDARYCSDQEDVNTRRLYIRSHRGWRRLPSHPRVYHF